MSKLIKFTDKEKALKASADEALLRGCGKNPEDITQFWFDVYEDVVFVPETDTLSSKDGVELKGAAKKAAEDRRKALTSTPDLVNVTHL